MAIIQADQELTAPHMPKANRRRRRGGRGKKNANAYLSDASSTDVSSDSSVDGSSSPRRRNKPQHAVLPEVSKEEQACYLAMDCEMVGTGYNGHTSSLARVTLVDWQGNPVLDQFIRQKCEVTDYRTFVSGITAEDLEEHGVDIADCRAKVLAALEGKVLVGHGLKNDLKALAITHPWQMTRDTAKYEPFMKVRFDDGILWPRKLKDLCEEKLHMAIQVAGKPHCPVEDAKAAMDLYRVVRSKWEKVMAYKIKKTQQIEEQKQQRFVAIAAC